MNWKFLPVLALAILSGCGVPNGKALKDLEDEDWTALCEEQGEESFTCEVGGASLTYTFGTNCDQVNGSVADGCEATVGDYRDCNDAWMAALREDPCYAKEIPECDWFASCIGL